MTDKVAGAILERLTRVRSMEADLLARRDGASLATGVCAQLPGTPQAAQGRRPDGGGQ